MNATHEKFFITKDDFVTIDAKWMRDKCFNCPREECVNCFHTDKERAFNQRKYLKKKALKTAAKVN